MKCISIRQPWAWLIIHGGKDVENRPWPTKFRGPLLIHASKGMTQREYEAAWLYAQDRGVWLPRFSDLQRGGIIGEVNLYDCAADVISPWFEGPFGFALRDPKPMEFVPMAGKLGLFNVSIGALPL